jgi:hypothetical protein
VIIIPIFLTVVDALKRYLQCAFDEESIALTTFSTPEGLPSIRLPTSISNAGDDYGRQFHDIFGHIPNTAPCMEDIIIFFLTYEEHPPSAVPHCGRSQHMIKSK